MKTPTDTALERIEAQIEAQNELLVIALHAVIAAAPSAGALREELAKATTYAGPSRGKQVLAALAKRATGGA